MQLTFVQTKVAPNLHILKWGYYAQEGRCTIEWVTLIQNVGAIH
jgi:hypothetical protein